MKYDFEVDISTNSTHSLILRKINRNSRVLEFGPATGYLTKHMKENLGCSVTGVEIDKEAAKRAREFCEDLIVADIDSLEWVEKLQGKSFDHIVFADVLEHLRNPLNALNFAKGFLHRDGTIITSIPNIAHNAIIMELLQGSFEYRQLGLLDETHIRFFTKKSIYSLLEKAQLSPIQWESTVIHPENTELEQKYKTFSEPLVEELLKREEGNVYQYITVSKRKEDINGNCTITSLKPYNNHPENMYLNLSWDKFSESGLKIPLKYGAGFQKYSTTIRNMVGNSIYLVPGQLPAFLQLKNIKVNTLDVAGNEREINCNVENNFSGLFTGPGTLFLKDTKCKNIILFNYNPQIHFQLPNENYKERLLISFEMSLSQEIPVNLINEDLVGQFLDYRSIVESIYESTSWRITSPIRWFGNILKRKD